MKNGSKVIKICLISLTILVIMTVLFVGVAIPKMKANDIAKEKAVIIERERVTAKLVADKKVLDKKISDKKILAKKIADKKISDKRIADKIEAKRIADENIASKIRENQIREDQRIADNRISNEKVKQYDSVVTIKYTMDGGYFTACNYPNGSTLQFKVGQVLKLQGNLLNGSTERIMETNGGTIFGGNTSHTMEMIAVGGADIIIIPEKYEWERAYTFHIVVSN